MNAEFWLGSATFVVYFIGIFGGLVVVIFLYFLVRELLHPTATRGAASSTTPDDDDVRLDDGKLDTEIGRSATQLAEHRAATMKRKELG